MANNIANTIYCNAMSNGRSDVSAIDDTFHDNAKFRKQYEYYANCNPHVVEAFINLRTQKQINEPNQFELLMPELKYNSKSIHSSN